MKDMKQELIKEILSRTETEEGIRAHAATFIGQVTINGNVHLPVCQFHKNKIIATFEGNHGLKVVCEIAE